ncbi:MAG: HEAT repeat domain-containing protein [Myxococcales bacterium]|nr:HEAT repeat domain-containing protein [Myxococcales bacterium]
MLTRWPGARYKETVTGRTAYAPRRARRGALGCRRSRSGLWLVLGMAPLLVAFEWEGRIARLEREARRAPVSERREAVRMLAALGAREAAPTLLELLRDADASVRLEAVRALGRLRIREATPALLEWLVDPDETNRRTALEALGRIGEARAVEPMTRALADASAAVRRVAIEALEAMGRPEALDGLVGRLDDVDPALRARAAEALGRLRDERAYVPLVARARDEAPEVRAAVLRALGELGRPAAASVAQAALADPVEEVRLAAIAALVRLGDAGALPRLVERMRAGSSREARAAAAALAQLPEAVATPRWIEALASPSVRSIVHEALVEHASDPVRGAALRARLADAIRDTATVEHATAVATVLRDALREHPDASIAPPIRAALERGAARREVLLAVLGRTGAPEALVPLLEHAGADDETGGAALDALETWFERHGPDGRAADPLVELLSRVPATRLPTVLRLVGRSGAVRAADAVLEYARASSLEARLAALEALGWLGSARAAPVLYEALDDRDARVRATAAAALGRVGASADAERLLARLERSEWSDRAAHLDALAAILRRHGARLEPRARRRIILWLDRLGRHDDEELAHAAIDGLGRLGTAEASQPLVTLLSEGAGSRARVAAAALAFVPTDVARRALRAAVGHPHRPLAAAAAASLGAIGEPADVEPLRRLALEAPWPVSAAAAFGLVRMVRRGVARAEVAATFCNLLRKTDTVLRANAMAGLAALGGADCGDSPLPVEDWLEPSRPTALRLAAIRWLGTRLPEPRAATLLERAARREPLPELARLARAPTLPDATIEADVVAWDADGVEILRNALVGLRAADGSVLVAHTDRNGRLRVPGLPAGPVVLEDPAGW